MFCYNRVIKPFLGKYTPPKIVMVDAGDLAKLGEVFGVDALPSHLGGRSELLSVPLSGDDGDAEREAGTSSLSATEKPSNARRNTDFMTAWTRGVQASPLPVDLEVGSLRIPPAT